MSFGRLNFRTTTTRTASPVIQQQQSPSQAQQKHPEVITDFNLKGVKAAQKRSLEVKAKDEDDGLSVEIAQSDGATVKRTRKSGGKHQKAACCACKKKRKKCDGKYPTCSGCQSSGSECTIFDLTTGRTIPRNYIEKLEERIAIQNKQIDILKGRDDISSIEKPTSVEDQIKNVHMDKTQLPKRCPKVSVEPSQFSHPKNNLENDIGYITLGVAAESHFIGQSSAFSMATAITNSIDYYNGKTMTSHLENSTYSQFQQDQSEEIFTKPTFTQAKKYIDTYNQAVQCQYPFLDWDEVLQWFEDVQQNNCEHPNKLFFIYMIYAIGSQIYSGSPKAEYTPFPSIRSYYKKAFDNITELTKSCTLNTVQAYLLLSVFSQHMPDGTSIWLTTGLAIRVAASLGLHRKTYKSMRGEESFSDREKHDINMKARVFWSAYSLERINGLILGRPFGISDIDIDVPSPSDDQNIIVACHVFKLRRIQSNISTFVYKPIPLMKNPEDIDSTRVSIVLELNDWMNTFPAKQNPVSKYETYNWCSISYHNSMLLLLRPVVLEVSKSKNDVSPRLLEWFKVFTYSASAICMNYKDLHAKGKLSITWLSMHCLFVSGLSFLYCLWNDNQLKVLEWKRKGIVYDTISACSSLLYVFAEKWNSAIVFRNTFEQISSAVLSKMEDSKEGRSDVSSVSSESTIKEQYPPSGKLHRGALKFDTIGINQYLSYENQIWRIDSSSEKDGTSIGAGTPERDASISFTTPNGKSSTMNTNAVNCSGASLFDNLDLSLWEFLDTTSDRYLRDIYQDLENNLGSL